MNEDMHIVPNILLSDGNSIPQVGLGVLRVDKVSMHDVVESALSLGYRHIDAAAGYNNENELGEVLRETGFNTGELRENLWVTTKVRDSQQGYDSTLKAFDSQLADLCLNYVDMYMIHWPTPFNWRSAETWKAFVKLKEEGRVRSLGVCNFMPSDLQRLYDEVGQWPQVNQIELHPSWQQSNVVDFCKKHNIAIEAYSPLARGRDLNIGDGVLETIAKNHDVTCAQVILRWHIEHGYIIIPKSVSENRQCENINVFGFSLKDDEIRAIDDLNTNERMGHDPATFSYA